MTTTKSKSGYEITLGADDTQPRVDGVRFWVRSAEIENQIRAAYAGDDAEFERVVDAICDRGDAEYRG